MFLDQSLLTSIETIYKRAEVSKKLEGREDVLKYARLVMQLNDSGASSRQKIDLGPSDEELASAIEPFLVRDEDNVITDELRLAGERGFQFRYSPLTYLTEQAPYSHASRNWIAPPRQLEKEYRAGLGLPKRSDAWSTKVWKFHPGQVLEYLDHQRRENPALFLLLLGDDIEAAETLFPKIKSVPSTSSGSGTDIEAKIFPDVKCSVATAFRIMREVKRAGSIVRKLGESAHINMKMLKELAEGHDSDLLPHRQNYLISALGNSTFALFKGLTSGEGRNANYGLAQQPIADLKASLLHTATEASGSLPVRSKLDKLLSEGSNIERVAGSGGRRLGELACYYGFDITELAVLMVVQTSATANSSCTCTCTSTHSIKVFARDWLLEHGARKRSPTSTDPASIKSEKVNEIRALDQIMFGERNMVLRYVGFFADSQDADRRRAEDWLRTVATRIPESESDRAGLELESLRTNLCKMADVPTISEKTARSAVPMAVGQFCSVGPESLDPNWSRLRERETRFALAAPTENAIVKKFIWDKAKSVRYKKKMSKKYNNGRGNQKFDSAHCMYDLDFLMTR